MTTLVLIDVQKDFHPGGSLAIPTANEDAERIATFIRANGAAIDRIVLTLDTHPKLHIAHSCFWQKGDNDDATTIHPNPFTIITSSDITNGIWKPREDIVLSSDDIDRTVFTNFESVLQDDGITIDVTKYCIEYTKLLEGSGKFQLCIWPDHCLLGTIGHTVVDCVADAISDWIVQRGRNVDYIQKGQNPFTEMYSVMSAEVPLTDTTSYNKSLQQSIQQSATTNLIFAGQALSHCVNYSIRDILQHWDTTTTTTVTKIYLLTDCTSSVPGFEEAGQQFVSDVTNPNNNTPIVTLIKSNDLKLY